MKHEAFIYLWYDAPNKMYYLGKHKGTPDDTYTHSSTIWERFTKDNIPKGVRRRILAYGTDKEMTDLETKLLRNRKERCWDRYYNVRWHSKSIGNLNDILSEEGIKLWKERMSLARKGKSRPELGEKLRKFHASITDDERKKLYGHAGEDAYNWKGGISSPENIKQYHEDKYKEYLELGMKLHNEGYSYYEIKSMYPKAKLPHHLIPREEKDRKNAQARGRYKHKRECYCRKSSCEYCNSLLLTPEELKRRQAERDAKKYQEQKNDPVFVENRRKKDRERYARKKQERLQGVGTLEPHMG